MDHPIYLGGKHRSSKSRMALAREAGLGCRATDKTGQPSSSRDRLVVSPMLPSRIPFPSLEKISAPSLRRTSSTAGLTVEGLKNTIHRGSGSCSNTCVSWEARSSRTTVSYTWNSVKLSRFSRSIFGSTSLLLSPVRNRNRSPR